MGSFIFIIPGLFIAGLFGWWLWHTYTGVPTLPGFTEAEKQALTRQVIALGAYLPFFLINVWGFVSGAADPAPTDGKGYFSVAYLLPGYVVLMYVAFSAIKNEVCILYLRGQSGPQRGGAAVTNGLLILVLLVIISVVMIVNPQ